MSDFNTIRNEIDYLQKCQLALNAETPKPLANNKGFVTYIIDSNLPCDLKYAGPDIRKAINKALNNMENCSTITAPCIDKIVQQSRRIIDAEKVIDSRDCNKAIPLEYADVNACDNFDIVLASVCKDVYNFQHASRRLRNDFTIAFAAIKYSKEIDGYDSSMLVCVGEELRDDYDFALVIIQYTPKYYLHVINRRLQNNRKLILKLADRLDAPPCKTNLDQIIVEYLVHFGRFNANNFEFICELLDIIKLKHGKDDFVTFALIIVINTANFRLSYRDTSINIVKKYNIKIPATHRSSFSKEFMEKYDALGIN